MAATAVAACTASLILSTACGIRPRSSVPDASTTTVITAEEIAATEAVTMWEALRRTVRYANFGESATGAPVRVHRRGFSSISLVEDMPIYIDRIQVRDLGILDALPAADIDRIEVMSGLEATTYYGTNAGDGVILIWTRRGG